MAFINDLSIAISLATKPISQESFSKILILGSRATGSSLINKYADYSDVTSMVSDGFTSADPEYKMASLIFGQSPCPDEIGAYIRDESESVSEALDALSQLHDDWYGLLITERDSESLHEAGDWSLGNEKMFIGCTESASALTGRNNIREAYIIHDDADNFPEAALSGMCFPETPGSITWKWKSPTGVTASTFDLTTLNAIRSGNGQTFSKRSGVVYSDEGITTGGEYIDVVMARDYVKARIGEAIFALQLKVDKIPFDNSGAAMLDACIREVLHQAGEDGIIAVATTEEDKNSSDEGEYMYTLSVPDRSDVPANDRAARKWTGITFKFTLAGAVHGTAIEGTITA